MAASLVEINPLPQPALLPGEEAAPWMRLRLLRLSVTDRCNFRCRYCMPAQGVDALRHDDLLSLERMEELVRWLARRTAIERVRLTGGEPLTRHGIEHLVEKLCATDGIREVSLTTNGTLLARMAWRLKAAGLSRVNISLDSLDAERFGEVSRGGNLQHTLEGIAAAWEAGLTPIKLNTVLRRSTWRADVPPLLDYAAENGFEIRFIELMRTGTERAWCDTEFIAVDEVAAGLHAEVVSVEDVTRASASRVNILWRGAPLTIGWITPRSHPFCTRCERIRMDAQGNLRRCLMDPHQMLLERTLQIHGDAITTEEFCNYIARKIPPQAMDNALAMSQIGG
jgi:cyclic pyranopterin phosphate synthase